MDTLFWTALNPNIGFAETRKLMYGSNLYRLVVQCPGAHLLRSLKSYDPIELLELVQRERKINYGGSWRQSTRLKVTDVELLDIMCVGRFKALQDGIRVMVTSNHVNFYAQSQQTLMKLTERITLGTNSHFIELMLPSSEGNKQLLEQGFTLRKRKPEYQYRIHLREGRYSFADLQKLRTWLSNFTKEDLLVPYSLNAQLQSNHSQSYLFGAYISVQDDRIATMLNMINPNLVSNIEEFYHIGNDE